MKQKPVHIKIWIKEKEYIRSFCKKKCNIRLVTANKNLYEIENYKDLQAEKSSMCIQETVLKVDSVP